MNKLQILKFLLSIIIVTTEKCQEDIQSRFLICYSSSLDDYNNYEFKINVEGKVSFKNSLINLPRRSFTNQEHSITYLWFANNNIGTIHRYAFENLKNLKRVLIEDNKISRIESEAFARERLNPIGSLHESLPLGNLENIYIEDNSITEIEPGGFQGLQHTKNWFSNKFEVKLIRSLNFIGLSKDVHSLYFHKTDIQYTEASSFDGLEGLESIIFIGNNIKLLSSNTFSNKSVLRNIMMSNTVIHEIQSNSFASLENVDMFIQPIFRIKKVPREAFNGLSLIYRLNLSYSGIEELEAGSFLGLNALQILNLSHNEINSLKYGVFEGMPNLKQLYLMYNNIKQVDRGTFEFVMKDNNLNVQLVQRTFEEVWLNENCTNMRYFDLFESGMDVTDIFSVCEGDNGSVKSTISVNRTVQKSELCGQQNNVQILFVKV